MSLLELVIGFVVFTTGCTIQGVLGFGAGLFAVPMQCAYMSPVV